MQLKTPLIRGRLLRRYKRFFADVALDGGATVTAHCPNPGSMLGLAVAGAEAILSESDDRKRKLRHTLELLRVDGALVGVNTGLANRIVAEALAARAIPELADYAEPPARGALRREQPHRLFAGGREREALLRRGEKRDAFPRAPAWPSSPTASPPAARAIWLSLPPWRRPASGR